MAALPPPMCSPSMTRTTFPRRSSTILSGVANGGRTTRRQLWEAREMSIELGHFALILAFATATLSALVGFAFWRSEGRIVLYVRQAAVLQFVLVAAAFAALIYAFVTSDFSLLLAYQHSHSLQPL